MDNRERIRLRLEAARAKAAPTAKLSEPASPVPRINELAATGKTLWFGLLSYLTFVGVTLLGVTDADFFLVERKTQLPLINVSIPTLQFFIFAPALGAILYIYLHLHLLKLWEAAALRRNAPAKIGRRPLSDLLSPWLVNDLALSLRTDDALHRRPLNKMANAASVLLVFVLPIAVLAFFWWRSMPVHSGWLTIVASGLPMMASIYVGCVSWFRLRRLANPKRKLRRGQSSALQVCWAIALGMVSAIGWFRTVEPLGTYLDPIFGSLLKNRDQEAIRMASGDPVALQELQDAHQRLIRNALWNTSDRNLRNNPLALAAANLSGEILVEKPADWRGFQTAKAEFRVKFCNNHGMKAEVCGLAPGAFADPANGPPFQAYQRLQWCKVTFDLKDSANDSPDALERACSDHFARLDAQFHRDWRTERTAMLTALPNRLLSGHDLRHANLSFAQMEGAVLNSAQMEGANLSGAQMEGAELNRAQMERAVLNSAQMERADFSFAQMDGAAIWFSRMEGADLTGAHLDRAILFGAQMQRANLTSTHMEGALLSHVRMEGANLRDAYLVGAALKGVKLDATTKLTGAIFNGVYGREIDFTSISISPAQVHSMFGDRSVILPTQREPQDRTWPAHWPKEVLTDDAFETQWRAWQARIGYTPPN